MDAWSKLLKAQEDRYGSCPACNKGFKTTEDGVETKCDCWPNEYHWDKARRILAAAKREGAVDLVFQLGLATGHADTMEDLVEHVREQLEEMRGNAKREGVEDAIGALVRQREPYARGRVAGPPTILDCLALLRALAKEMEQQ